MRLSTRSALLSAVMAGLTGGILSIVALVVVISQSGYAEPSNMSIVLTYLAYWPMLLIGIKPHNLFVSFWLVPANIAAWSIIGSLVALIRTAVSRDGNVKID
jgi:hypothetical protein